MQYLSGVWESLKGQASAKRKRSGDETEALPERMTSLKLFSDQCPGRLQSSTTYSRLPEQHLYDAGSSATADGHFQAASSYCTSGSDNCHASGQRSALHTQDSNLTVPPRSLDLCLGQQKHSHNTAAGSSYARHSSHRAPAQTSFTGYAQQHYALPQYSNSTQHTFREGQQHDAFQATGTAQNSSSFQHSRSAYTQPARQTADHRQPHQQHTTVPAATTGLFCSESLSPEAYCKTSPDCDSTNVHMESPDLDLSESVADSPDDNGIFEEIISSPSSPIPGVLMAFLAVCQSPQVITALSKLQASHQLPCPTTFSVLPLSTQQCSVAMSTELMTASSMVQLWSKASQMEWTLAGMFALCLRAGLDPLDMDATMLLSLLWILGISSVVPLPSPTPPSLPLALLCALLVATALL